MKSNKVMWNYEFLNMFISRFGGVEKVADAAGIPVKALKKRLNNQMEFNAQEIQTLRYVLMIPAYCVESVFFNAVG